MRAHFSSQTKIGNLFRIRKEKGIVGLPTLSVTLNQGIIRRETLTRKMDTNLSPNEHLLVRKGDIAYNVMRMWQGAVGVAKEDGIISPAYVVCSPKKNVCSTYFYHFFHTPILLKRFHDYAYGITDDRLRLYFKDFEKILVEVPDYFCQCKIANILDNCDKTIELNELLLSEKKERRKWLVQQLLTEKIRLPSFKKSWRSIHLGDVFTNRVETNRITLPLVSITSEAGVILRGNLDRRDNSSEDKSKYLRICPGDIGYNTMRMWQGVSGLSKVEGIVSPAYTIVTPKSCIHGEFMALLFKVPSIINLFHRYSQGLVDDTLNLKWENFSKIKISIPEKAEQKAISEIFEIFDHEIHLLREKLAALKEQKKGLMQNLLTGKIRVKVD
jgi:type I restriction enzyme S subunit